MVSKTEETNVASAAIVTPARGNSYACEVPSMLPGLCDIKINQNIAAQGHGSLALDTAQRTQIQKVSPYSPLPPVLVHSFYPPHLRTVSANTLPHFVLNGSLPWERPVQNLPTEQQQANGGTPVPWLALLVFTADELHVPEDDVLTVSGVVAKPSATMAINLPVVTVNTYATKYSMAKPFPLEVEGAVSPSAADGESEKNMANFIFVKQPVFKEYFTAQEGVVEGDASANLQRYPYLAHVTDTEDTDDPGHSKIKVSMLLGHRIRPWAAPAVEAVSGEQQHTQQQPLQEPLEVYAHLVSLEHIRHIISDAKTGDNAASVVPLVSLFSWTYIWDIHAPTGDSSDLFEKLNIRPLVVPLPDLSPGHSPNEAETWMRSWLDSGYAVVRHRDIAGEASMALFRGPLIPKPRSQQGSGSGRIPVIKPSMYGTDMQVVDAQTKIADVSYSVAWDLGRSLAGRDAKFSHAVLRLRKELTAHAMMRAREVGQPNVIQGSDAQIDSVLGRLDKLFEGSLAQKLEGMPEKRPIRWRQSPAKEVVCPEMTGEPSVTMTEAKLRRHLAYQTRNWVHEMVKKLAHSAEANLGQSTDIEVPALGVVIKWVLQNLLSLSLVPAMNMFPNTSAITAEGISMFVVDDIWVDALVDGALSIGNTFGGSDDPVRNETRIAINKYILLAGPERANIAAAGIVIKSQLVESFPDLNVTAKCDLGSAVNPTVMRQASHGDLIVCLFKRTTEQRLEDFKVDIKLPPHQQRFAIKGIKADSMEFDIQLGPFLKSPEGSEPSTKNTIVDVTWKRGEKGCPWSWDTGMLSPSAIVSLMESTGEQWPGGGFKKLAAESASVYLAIQLADRGHSLEIPFNVRSDVQRQLFKHLETPDVED